MSYVQSIPIWCPGAKTVNQRTEKTNAEKPVKLLEEETPA